MASVEKHLESVNVLLDRVSALVKTVNRMFPELEMEDFEWIEDVLAVRLLISVTQAKALCRLSSKTLLSEGAT